MLPTSIDSQTGGHDGEPSACHLTVFTFDSRGGCR
jgi:hypothetical protein